LGHNDERQRFEESVGPKNRVQRAILSITYHAIFYVEKRQAATARISRATKHHFGANRL